MELIRRDFDRYGRGILLAGVYIFLVGGIFRQPICPLAYTTGYPCPGCGLTRAAMLFLKGDFFGAYCMHPFFYILLVWLLLLILLRYGFRRDIGWMRHLVIVIAAAAILFYLYRMWAYFPNREPMVYETRSFWAIFRNVLS